MAEGWGEDMTSFDRAWDLVKLMPTLATSHEQFSDKYEEVLGDRWETDGTEGQFMVGDDGKHHVMLNLPNIGMGTGFKMLDSDLLDNVPDEHFDEWLASSQDKESPLFERFFERNFVKNLLHELGHHLTNDEAIDFYNNTINQGIDDENRFGNVKRLNLAQESLAHILQEPHNRDWRRSMRNHATVGDVA